MTALERYVRLEALGLWREGPGAEPREVVVSFGAATLVLTDLDDRPLGHWALAGVQTLGREGRATVYAMTREGGETLTIRDRDMVDAIAAVVRSHGDPVPARRTRRRLPLGLLALAAAAVLAAAAAPRAIRWQAARMVPPERAEELGDRMLIGLMEAHGGLCDGPEGRRALGAIAARVDPAAPPRLRVLDLGAAPAVALPGRTVLIDRAALERASGPGEVAGWASAALAQEPLAQLMAAAGPVSGLRYILTGDLSEAALARAAAALAPPVGPVPAAAVSLPESEWEALREACG